MTEREYQRRLRDRLAEVADGCELEAFARGTTVPESVREIRALITEWTDRETRVSCETSPSCGASIAAYCDDLVLRERWPAEELTEPERRELADVLASSERYDPHGDEPGERALQSGLRKVLALRTRGGV